MDIGSKQKLIVSSLIHNFNNGFQNYTSKRPRSRNPLDTLFLKKFKYFINRSQIFNFVLLYLLSTIHMMIFNRTETQYQHTIPSS